MRTATTLLLVLAAGSGLAADRWETGTSCDDDGALTTCNELVHGTLQMAHDLEGPTGTPDQDWFVVQTRERRSYEARVRSNTLVWDGPTCLSSCSRIDRVDAGGTILTAGIYPGAGVGPGGVNRSTVVVRWQAAAAEKQYLRVLGLSASGESAADQYDLEFFDTTAFVPRFNNTSSQVTVLIVQNTTPDLVTGSIRFQNAAGDLVHTAPLSVTGYGVQLLNTSTVSALAGMSGSVAIAHNGGYGALAGKAVAIEPETGFTFDTPLEVVPR
jgi:hypothetical protein